MASDRNSQAVEFVEPNTFHRAGLAVGQDDRLAYKLGLSPIEFDKDCGCARFGSWHGMAWLGLDGARGVANDQLVGARQILQCVGKIKIGSSAQALYQTPNFRRQGKRNDTMPVLSSSPTSKSQSSGASWIGSHGTA
jgi:hypothetical protein